MKDVSNSSSQEWICVYKAPSIKFIYVIHLTTIEEAIFKLVIQSNWEKKIYLIEKVESSLWYIIRNAWCVRSIHTSSEFFTLPFHSKLLFQINSNFLIKRFLYNKCRVKRGFQNSFFIFLFLVMYKSSWVSLLFKFFVTMMKPLYRLFLSMTIQKDVFFSRLLLFSFAIN